MGNEQARSARGEATLHGISAMDQKMQEKFSKGIQFNSEQMEALSRAGAPSRALSYCWSGGLARAAGESTCSAPPLDHRHWPNSATCVVIFNVFVL